MKDCNIIDIGLSVIKQCGMYSEEYKNWIACRSETLAIIETIDSFKEYWACGIMLVNQMSILAMQHGYGMAAMDNIALHVSYSKLLANFGAAYAATQETIKTQATSMAAMQGQLTNIQQFCMAVGQQPPPTIYTPTQQQHMSNNRHGRRNGGGHDGGSGGGNSGGGFPQQPTWFGGNGASAQQQSFPPTPYKRWENWNYCHTHGGDVVDAHVSATCGNCSPTHNPNARAVPTSWAAQSPECTRPSCHWHVAASHPPPVAPSSSSSHSNDHQVHTTPPKAQMPHPRILEQSNLPVAPTASGQPWPCRLFSPVKP